MTTRRGLFGATLGLGVLASLMLERRPAESHRRWEWTAVEEYGTASPSHRVWERNAVVHVRFVDARDIAYTQGPEGLREVWEFEPWRPNT